MYTLFVFTLSLLPHIHWDTPTLFKLAFLSLSLTHSVPFSILRKKTHSTVLHQTNWEREREEPKFLGRAYLNAIIIHFCVFSDKVKIVYFSFSLASVVDCNLFRWKRNFCASKIYFWIFITSFVFAINIQNRKKYFATRQFCQKYSEIIIFANFIIETAILRSSA